MMVSARLTPEAKAALIRQHLDDGVPLTRLAASAGLPARTLRRWAASYRTDPTASALQRQERSDLGRRRLPEDLVAAIEALALRRPPPTTAYVHRIGDLARDRDLPAPNYSTVRSVVAAIDPGLRTLAHDGDAAYRNQFELIHRCTARPNEQWQADHTLLDLQILDVKQQPARPWLTIVLDDYSAQLVADAAASSALQVAHATAVEGYLPVPAPPWCGPAAASRGWSSRRAWTGLRWQTWPGRWCTSRAALCCLTRPIPARCPSAPWLKPEAWVQVAVGGPLGALDRDSTLAAHRHDRGSALTTWAWAQLAEGSYGLPGPAVVTSPWVLEARAPRPQRRGFTRVRRPEQWGRVRTARNMAADCGDPSEVLVISAEHPADVDAAGLRNSTPGAAAAGGTHWVMGGVFHELHPPAFRDQVHQAGRLLLLTGDLQAYWSGVRTGATTSFAELFPHGAWAAWVPLLLHLYPDGVGTRPV